MTVVTVRPDTTVLNLGSTVTGAGGDHDAALADNSDASYVVVSDFLRVGFANPTIPAGALTKSVTLRVRNADPSGSHTLIYGIDKPDSTQPESTVLVTWTSPTTITVLTAPWPTADNASGLTAWMFIGDSASVRTYELYADVTVVTKPVTDVTAPTGTPSGNLPTVQWTNTLDSDGGAQTRYEVKIFSSAQYGAGGFSPATSASTLTSGQVASGSTSYTPATGLPDGNYRAYVRVAQTVNGVTHWSDWDYSAFTISVVLPPIPSMTLTAESASARIKLALAAGSGGATTDYLEIERSTAPGATAVNEVTNPSFEVDTSGWSTAAGLVNSGASITRVSETRGPGDFAADITTTTRAANQGAVTLVNLKAGTQYRVRISAEHRAGTGTFAVRLVRNSSPFTSYAVGTIPVNTALTELTALITPTFTGQYALLVENTSSSISTLRIDGAMVSAADVAYFDGDTTGYRWTGTPHSSTSEAAVTWEQIRTVDGDGQVSGLPATAYDLEAPNGTTTSYRARAVHVYNGVPAVSGWTYGTSSWSSSSWWLKHPQRPELNTTIVVDSLPSRQRPANQAVFQPLGRRNPIVVSDVRSGERGTLRIQSVDATAKAKLDALLDPGEALLLQGPPTNYEPDRYIAVGDHERTRFADKAFVQPVLETLPWVEVDSPSQPLVAWPA